MKKRLIVRTMAGFLSVWLVFAAVLSFSVLQWYQQRVEEDLRYSAKWLQEDYRREPEAALPRKARLLQETCQKQNYLETGVIYDSLNRLQWKADDPARLESADREELALLAEDPYLHELAYSALHPGNIINDGICIISYDGHDLPYGRYYMEVEMDDGWVYALAARTTPVRNALQALTIVWGSSLLLVLVSGRLVCRALCRVYDQQSALEQSRRDTTNALAHDLKTPLALIRGYAENLQFGVKPEKDAHYLARIQEEAGRMDGILGAILELSRMESQTLPLHPEPVELRAFTAEAAGRWQSAAEAQGVTLSAGGSGTLHADRELLGRALDNLLSNALRHTPAGGTIQVTASGEGLSVENTGAPIPEDALPRLFDAYYTGDRSRGRQHGLGLAIVRAIAERHGLYAYAENTAEGVRFFIRKAKPESHRLSAGLRRPQSWRNVLLALAAAAAVVYGFTANLAGSMRGDTADAKHVLATFVFLGAWTAFVFVSSRAGWLHRLALRFSLLTFVSVTYELVIGLRWRGWLTLLLVFGIIPFYGLRAWLSWKAVYAAASLISLCWLVFCLARGRRRR